MSIKNEARRYLNTLDADQFRNKVSVLIGNLVTSLDRLEGELEALKAKLVEPSFQTDEEKMTMPDQCCGSCHYFCDSESAHIRGCLLIPTVPSWAKTAVYFASPKVEATEGTDCETWEPRGVTAACGD